MTGPAVFRGLRFSACGDPAKVLGLEEVPTQSPGPGEVLLRMLAAPVNPADLNFIQGVYGRRPEFDGAAGSPGSPCGLEGCGLVEQSRAAELNPGDRVIVLDGLGTWGERMVLPAERVLRVDPSLPAEQAAMLKVNPMTALCLLTGFGALQPGDWIAQNAANSGVGRCVIQLARLLGLRSLNFVRRQAERLEALRGLGADVVLEDGDPQAVGAALEATDGSRPLLALNGVGGASAANLLGLLGPRGCLVSYGGMSRRGVQVSTAQLVFQGLELRGFWLSEWLWRAGAERVRADYARLGRWVAEGRLVQAVDAVYPLAQFEAAVRRAQEPFRDGRVLFDLRD